MMNVFKRAEQRFEDWLVAKKQAGFDKEIQAIKADLDRINTGWTLSGVSIEHDGSTKHNIDDIHAFYQKARMRFRRLVNLLGYSNETEGQGG